MNRNDGGIFFLAVSCLAGKPLVRQRALSCTGRGFMPVQVPRAAQEVARGALLRLAGELQEALP